MPRYLPAALLPTRGLASAGLWAMLGMPLVVLLAAVGCNREPDITQYTVDTNPPEEMETEQQLIGAIVPQEDAVWFFKIVGPADDVQPLADDVRQWVADVEFEDGQPVLELPEGWTRRDGGPMRLATVEIPTESDLPLEMSVSQLSRGEDWDELVAMNVNRWRGQMGLDPSDEPHAGAEPLVAGASADDDGATAMWVDLTGTFGGGPSSMAPFASGGAPFAGGAGGAPFAGGAGGAPRAGTGAGGAGAAAPPTANGESPRQGEPSQTGTPGFAYDTPEGWRPGRMSAMRWAAFNVGPEDREAELTVIPAGGDIRGNVERWLGQIRPDGVEEELLDQVIAEAEEVTVDGRTAQRFQLPGSGEPPQAIDATIVPLDEGRSLFIKLTGDARTVAEQSDEVGQFLESFQISR